MLPPPLAGRDMALAAARSTPKLDTRLVRSVSSNSFRLVVWAAGRGAQAPGGGRLGVAGLAAAQGTARGK